MSWRSAWATGETLFQRQTRAWGEERDRGGGRIKNGGDIHRGGGSLVTITLISQGNICS